MSNWIRGKNTPKYSILCKLIEMGAGIDEVFTPEIWEIVKVRFAADLKSKVVLSEQDCVGIVQKGLGLLKDGSRDVVIRTER